MLLFAAAVFERETWLLFLFGGKRLILCCYCMSRFEEKAMHGCRNAKRSVGKRDGVAFYPASRGRSAGYFLPNQQLGI